jgi:hypothetical protein
LLAQLLPLLAQRFARLPFLILTLATAIPLFLLEALLLFALPALLGGAGAVLALVGGAGLLRWVGVRGRRGRYDRQGERCSGRRRIRGRPDRFRCRALVQFPAQTRRGRRINHPALPPLLDLPRDPTLDQLLAVGAGVRDQHTSALRTGRLFGDLAELSAW